MDPVTAALNLCNKLLDFGIKVFDATPDGLKAQSAADWAKFNHNIASVIFGLQDKINAVIGVKSDPTK